MKASWNRYIMQEIGNSALVNPIKISNDTRPWTVCAAGQTSGCDLNGDKIPQLNELGPSTGFNLGIGTDQQLRAESQGAARRRDLG